MTNTLPLTSYNGIPIRSMSDLHIVTCEQLLARLELFNTTTAYDWAVTRVDADTHEEATVADYLEHLRTLNAQG